MGLSKGISCQGTLMWESLVMGMTVGELGVLGPDMELDPNLISIIVNAVTKKGLRPFTTPCWLYGIIQ